MTIRSLFRPRSSTSSRSALEDGLSSLSMKIMWSGIPDHIIFIESEDNPSSKALRDDVLDLGLNRLRIVIGQVPISWGRSSQIIDVGNHCQRVPMVIRHCD